MSWVADGRDGRTDPRNSYNYMAWYSSDCGILRNVVLSKCDAARSTKLWERTILMFMLTFVCALSFGGFQKRHETTTIRGRLIRRKQQLHKIRKGVATAVVEGARLLSRISSQSVRACGHNGMMASAL